MLYEVITDFDPGGGEGRAPSTREYTSLWREFPVTRRTLRSPAAARYSSSPSSPPGPRRFDSSYNFV